MIESLSAIILAAIKAIWLLAASIFGWRLLTHPSPAKKKTNDTDKVENEVASCCKGSIAPCACMEETDNSAQVKILYGSMKGTSKKFAEDLERLVASQGESAVSCDSLEGIDVESILSLPKDSILIILISTYENGSPPLPAQLFVSSLEDAANDFRVGRYALQHIRFSVFGCGNRSVFSLVLNPLPLGNFSEVILVSSILISIRHLPPPL